MLFARNSFIQQYDCQGSVKTLIYTSDGTYWFILYHFCDRDMNVIFFIRFYDFKIIYFNILKLIKMISGWVQRNIYRPAFFKCRYVYPQWREFTFSPFYFPCPVIES